MLRKPIFVGLALLVLAQPALAQNARSRPAPRCDIPNVRDAQETPNGRDALSAKVADLTVRTAFSSSASPSQRELLAILLLMLVPPARGNGG